MEKRLILWEITHNCNYNCSYCFIKKTNNSEDDINKVLEKFRALPEKWTIMIMGGEPFQYPDFENILEKIINTTKHDICVITNFSAPIEKIIKIIKNSGGRLKKIISSLHLEYISSDEFLKKSLIVKKYANKYNCKFAINCVAIKQDLKKRAKIGKLFRKNGLQFILVPHCDCFGNLNYYSKKEKKIIKRFKQTFGLSSVNFKDRICLAGKKYFIIDPMGNARRCYSELGFDPMKKSIGKNTDSKFGVYKQAQKCPYPLCTCEIPYITNKMRKEIRNDDK